MRKVCKIYKIVCDLFEFENNPVKLHKASGIKSSHDTYVKFC